MIFKNTLRSFVTNFESNMVDARWRMKKTKSKRSKGYSTTIGYVLESISNKMKRGIREDSFEIHLA